MYLTISEQSLIALKIELKIKLKSYSIKPVQSSLVTYTLPVMVIHLVLLREHSPSFIHRSAATDTGRNRRFPPLPSETHLNISKSHFANRI